MQDWVTRGCIYGSALGLVLCLVSRHTNFLSSRLGRRTLMESDRLPTAGAGFIHHNNKICQVLWPYDRFYSWPPPPLFCRLKDGSGKNVNFKVFWLQIGPLCVWNLTQNPWDYKTRAQELTSGAIRMLLSFFVRIWEHFKDGRVWGLFYRIYLGVKFDNFYIFLYILALDGQIWIKLVTKLKIFWCSNWFW